MPDGLGTLLLRRSKPTVVKLMHWQRREDVAHLRDSQRHFEAARHHAAGRS